MRPFCSGCGAAHFPQPEPQPTFFPATVRHNARSTYAVAEPMIKYVAMSCMEPPR